MSGTSGGRTSDTGQTYRDDLWDLAARGKDLRRNQAHMEVPGIFFQVYPGRHTVSTDPSIHQ